MMKRHQILLMVLALAFCLPLQVLSRFQSPDLALLGQSGGSIEAVAVSDGLAYVGIGPRLAIVDVADANRPTLLSLSPPLPGVIRDIAIAEAQAYVAAGEGGLVIIDISDAGQPRLLGSYQTPDSAHGVAVARGYAFVAAGESGLRAIAISDPAHPSEVGYLDTARLATSVAIQGDFAYVSDTPQTGQGGALYVVQVFTEGLSMIQLPLPSQIYETPGEARSVAVSGDYAYIADGNGLRVLNVSDPTQISETSFLPLSGWTLDVTLAGDYAYVSSGRSGLQIVHIAAPGTPLKAGQLDTAGYARCAVVAGEFAYVADEDALRIIHIEDPNHPAYPGGPVEIGQTGTTGDAQDVALAGGYAFIAESPRYDWGSEEYVGGGLRVFDISDPQNPRQVGYAATPGWAQRLAISGTLAYIADDDSLRILDIATLTAPSELGSLPGETKDVAVAGGYAYVAAGSDGLRIVDISDNIPQEVQTFATAGLAGAVAVRGDYAYVCTGNVGVRVIDVSDPSSPSETGYYLIPSSGWAEDITFAGNYALVAARHSGVYILDISTPPWPREVGAYNTPGDARQIAASGGYAFVADTRSGVRVLDISQPAAPREASAYTYPLLGEARAVALAGGNAYLVDNQGLRVLDVSHPELLLQVPLGHQGAAHDVAVANGYAYVAARANGLRILDVSALGADYPTEKGALDTPGDSVGVALSGDLHDGRSYAYVADGDGLRIVDVSNPAQPAEVSFCPISGRTQGLALGSDGGERAFVYLANIPVGTISGLAGGGLHVLDVTSPTQPVELAYYSMDWVEDIAVAEGLAYIVAGEKGLHILDISDTAAITETGVYTLPGANAIAILGDYAYATNGAGLYILEVSDPAHPREVAITSTPGNAAGIALGTRAGRRYAYVLDAGSLHDDVPGRIHVVDVTNPLSPRRLASYTTPGEARAVRSASGTLFIADGTGGLLVLAHLPASRFLPLLLRGNP